MPVLLLLLAALSTGCLVGRGGGIIFPTQTEVGMVTMTDGEHAATGVRARTELSWASVSPNGKTPVDVGIGYQIDDFGQAPAQNKTYSHSAETSSTVFHGPVLEVSKNMGGGENRRQWIGARAEMPMRQVGSKQEYGIGASIRASIELFLTANERGVIGALGIGSYVESGVRKLPGGRNAFVMSTGLSLRLPLAVVD